MATRLILNDLASLYERRTRRAVAIRSLGGVEVAEMVRAGEPADVVVLASNVLERLEAEGHLVAGSPTGFARSGIAVAVRSGRCRPDIGDARAVRQAVLNAASICYSTGPSGDHLVRLLREWGIAEGVAERAIQAPPGVPVATMVAQGEAELGFQQFSELLNQPGIDVVGPLPSEIQKTTLFSAGIPSTSSRPDEARALIEFLTSPEAEAGKRRHGMEPA